MQLKMIIRILILSFILLTANIAFAEKYFVFINQGVGFKETDKRNSGNSEIGDVVEILPSGNGGILNSEIKPTTAELQRYRIVIVDLTAQEKENLLSCECEELDSEGKQEFTRARKSSVDYKTFSTNEQKAEIPKNEFIQKVSTKPSVPVVVEPVVFWRNGVHIKN